MPSMVLSIADDFDPDKIIACGQCFRAVRMPGGRFRFIHQGHVLLIRPLSPGVFEADTDAQTWDSVWFPYFDLGRSYREIRQAIPLSDPFLCRASTEGSGIRILRQDPWEMLLTFIISQRKSIPAIRQCVELICERWGTPVPTAEGQVYAFPSAEQLSRATEGDFRACKAGYRAPYLCDAVRAVREHRPDLDQIRSFPSPDLLDALMTVKGVGIKVASCVALFAYCRTDAAPIDTWIRKIIDTEYAGINPFPAWGDAAGILQQYAFYYALNHKEEFAVRHGEGEECGGE